MPQRFEQPAPAELTWDGARPASAAFEDTYFSAADGLAETETVFLRGNELPARFAGARRFAIGELGLGTGLNCLAAWRAFDAATPPGAVLEFVTVEAHPMAAADMLRALSAWPELADIAEPLAAACTDLNPGFNLRVLFGGRLRLLVLVGDAAAQLAQLNARIDAWFLDGFSPAKNPAMWSPEVCAQLARLSAADATLASYTAAGWVRRNLQAAGFAVEKQPGFAGKRERIVGWLANVQTDPRPAVPARVDVVGGGVAGANTARALAECGMRVTVWDDTAAGAPSRLPALVIRDFPERSADLRGQFYRAAFHHAAQRLAGSAGWHPTGVALVHHFDKAPPASSRAAALSTHAGTHIETDGQWLPTAGWIDPAAWCAALLDHPAIEVRRAQWTPGQTCGPVVISAGAAGLAELPDLFAEYQATPARGQLTEVTLDRALSSCVAGAGLAAPNGNRAWLGSTLVRDDWDLQPRAAESGAIQAKWAAHAPSLAAARVTDAAVGVRVNSRDRMPLVGRTETEQVWLNWGHGSRGATAAPLCGQLIAAQLCGAALPVDQATLDSLDPRRFRRRTTRRQQPSA